MVQKVAKYELPVMFVVEIGPDKNSTVSPNHIVINENKYLDLQKIADIKTEAGIKIKNCIVDAIVKTEAEIQLRDLFCDVKQTMPVSHELVEWFLDNSHNIFNNLKYPEGINV